MSEEAARKSWENRRSADVIQYPKSPAPKSSRATPWVWGDPKTMPPREFAYRTHYIRKFVSAGIGAPGGGKSSKRMVEALTMASGRALLGVKVTGDDFETAARAIRAGNWKGSIQAKDWVGIPIAKALDLKLTVKAEKAKVRA
jgi:hypothetical protein